MTHFRLFVVSINLDHSYYEKVCELEKMQTKIGLNESSSRTTWSQVINCTETGPPPMYTNLPRTIVSNYEHIMTWSFNILVGFIKYLNSRLYIVHCTLTWFMAESLVTSLGMRSVTKSHGMFSSPIYYFNQLRLTRIDVQPSFWSSTADDFIQYDVHQAMGEHHLMNINWMIIIRY